MSLPLSLLRGERAVWAGQYGRHPRRRTIEDLLGFLVMWGILSIGLCVFLRIALREGVWFGVMLMAPLWLLVTWGVARGVNDLFSGALLGERHLVVRSWFIERRIPLFAIRACRQRFVLGMQAGVPADVATGEIDLVLRDGQVLTIGPLFGSDAFADLLAGILAGAIDPATLPSFDPEAVTTKRPSQLLWIRPSRGQIQHGSLVVTPRWLAYFATPLGVAHEAQLTTLMASTDPIEAIEERLVALAQLPDVGVVRLVERAFYNVRLVGRTWLMVGSPPEDVSAQPKPGYRVLTTAPAGPTNEEIIPLEPLAAAKVAEFLRRGADA